MQFTIRYYISTAISKVIHTCSVGSLRALNVAILPLICFLVVNFDVEAHARYIPATIKPTRSWGTALALDASPLSLHQLHTAVNICLFPPLFFFSALYYTDVASTASVMICLAYIIHTHREDSPTTLQSTVTVLLGLMTLFFRQTNIFWVSVFPAGIVLLSKLDLGVETSNGEVCQHLAELACNTLLISTRIRFTTPQCESPVSMVSFMSCPSMY